MGLTIVNSGFSLFREVSPSFVGNIVVKLESYSHTLVNVVR